jgi:hypothetical protein
LLLFSLPSRLVILTFIQADSVEEANLNVTFSYLAVLLGFLALTKDTARQMRLDLPGHSLKSLIVAVDEFIDHNRKVDTQSGDGVEVQNSQSGLAEKLSRMLARLRAMEEESQLSEAISSPQ